MLRIGCSEIRRGTSEQVHEEADADAMAGDVVSHLPVAKFDQCVPYFLWQGRIWTRLARCWRERRRWEDVFFDGGPLCRCLGGGEFDMKTDTSAFVLEEVQYGWDFGGWREKGFVVHVPHVEGESGEAVSELNENGSKGEGRV
eukprot:GFKZ01012002.1.p1 GENE.GFKZ01012002.1~~GFKZ01012002.1.p1  ORF type:complete len:143 (-),score=11.36 GFKZ01012002.1:12-440(-)